MNGSDFWIFKIIPSCKAALSLKQNLWYKIFVFIYTCRYHPLCQFCGEKIYKKYIFFNFLSCLFPKEFKTLKHSLDKNGQKCNRGNISRIDTLHKECPSSEFLDPYFPIFGLNVEIHTSVSWGKKC